MSTSAANDPSDAVAGIDPGPITAWLTDRVGSLAGPLRFDPIAGGHSNLTYDVTDGDRRWVLRRPPLGQVLATAHDMGREHLLMSALNDSAVPVPTMIGLCEDDSINGAPFFMMDWVDGTVIRNARVAETTDPAARERSSRSIATVLGHLHAIDPDDVGLGDLAKREDYIGRQLRRWQRQFHASKTRDLPAIDEVHDALASAIPDQGAAGIVHGDYRLDNCIIGADGEVAAVLDWELCTLGDVRADLGLLLVYWAEPNDPIQPLDAPPTTVEGFASRQQLLDWYAEDTGRDVSNIDYFVAFSYWRLACILEGVYSRYLANVMGEPPPDLASFGDRVVALADLAKTTLDGGR